MLASSVYRQPLAGVLLGEKVEQKFVEQKVYEVFREMLVDLRRLVGDRELRFIEAFLGMYDAANLLRLLDMIHRGEVRDYEELIPLGRLYEYVRLHKIDKVDALVESLREIGMEEEAWALQGLLNELGNIGLALLAEVKVFDRLVKYASSLKPAPKTVPAVKAWRDVKLFLRILEAKGMGVLKNLEKVFKVLKIEFSEDLERLATLAVRELDPQKLLRAFQIDKIGAKLDLLEAKFVAEEILPMLTYGAGGTLDSLTRLLITKYYEAKLVRLATNMCILGAGK